MEGTLQQHQVQLAVAVGHRLSFVGEIIIINLREIEMEKREEISGVHIVHKRREEEVEGGNLNMVFSVTNRLWFVGKILLVDVREAEREEREEISRVHIVH